MSPARCFCLLLFHLIHLGVALHGEDDMQGFHPRPEPKEQVVPPHPFRLESVEGLTGLQLQQNKSIQNPVMATATDARDAKENILCTKEADITPIKMADGDEVTFQSPRFPQKYPLNKHCGWQLEGTHNNIRFNISCDSFRLQNIKNGHCYDYLRLDRKRFCGKFRSRPLGWTSSSNLLTITFNSNKRKIFAGFICMAKAYNEMKTTTTPPSTTTTSPSTTETGTNCAELLDKGMTQSGVYTITPEGFPDGVDVYCDQETDGGGWTVFLQRSNNTISPQVDFARTFEEYSTGFGDLNTEFWIGNRILHSMTLDGPFTLRVEAKNPDNEKRYGVWKNFSVGSEDTKFTLSLDGYSSDMSTLGDSLTPPSISVFNYTFNGMMFSTMDQNNDRYPGGDCSVEVYENAGWWFNYCGNTNPTGPFGGDTFDTGKVYWIYWDPSTSASMTLLSEIQFKIRPPLG